MKRNPTQEFDLTIGHIDQAFDQIVIVTQIGCDDRFGRFMPNCVKYIYVGELEYHGDGAYWAADMNHPHGGTFRGDSRADEFGRMDRRYFSPWSGRGVFYATKDAAIVERIVGALRRESAKKNRDVEHIRMLEQRLATLFANQIATEGFS